MGKPNPNRDEELPLEQQPEACGEIPRSDPAEMTGIGASARDIVASKQRPRPGLRVSKKAGRESFSPAAVEGAVARGFLLGHRTTGRPG
jgi:hypothetical protein